MDRIWRELRVLKEMQESDFHATMAGFQSVKSSFEAIQRGLDGVEQGIVTLQKSTESHYRHQADRMDKLEEAVHLLQAKIDKAS